MEERKCLRCGAALQRVAQDTIQMGKTSWIFGDLPNLLSGGLDVVIMACPDCGELSFFVPTEQEREEQALGALVKTCPSCGKKHHMADRRCPHCGHTY